MKRKVLIKIMIIILFLTLITGGNVKAVYQSTPYTQENPSSQTWDNWLNNMRTMETTGGAMGLNETLNGTTATSESNNLDVHMMKGTEYGAIAILSASGYGNINNTQKPETSTADTAAENKTGVYYNYNNWEFTACIAAQEVGSSFSRYWDKYNTLGLRGMSPSQTWHGGSAGKAFGSGYLYKHYLDNHGTLLINVQSHNITGRVGTRLAAGYNGIFSYYWDAKGNGYADNGWAGGSWADFIHYEGPYYSSHSFYARGAAVNMSGI